MCVLEKLTSICQKGIWRDFIYSISVYWREHRIRVLDTNFWSSLFCSSLDQREKWLSLHFDRVLWSFRLFHSELRKKVHHRCVYHPEVDTATLYSHSHHLIVREIITCSTCAVARLLFLQSFVLNGSWNIVLSLYYFTYSCKNIFFFLTCLDEALQKLE